MLNLIIEFENLNKKEIDVKFKINNSSEYFETKFGKITLSYSELENKEIIKENEKINNFTFYYEDKEYLKNMKDFQDSRKPNNLDFKLNEFKGQKFAFLNREYVIRNDSIFINDISAKVTGVNNRCLVKK